MVDETGAAVGRAGRTRWRHRWALPFLLAVVLIVGSVGLPALQREARAANSNTYYINTNAFGKAGTCVAGSDSYDPTGVNNKCTLGAAMTAANASATKMTITLATDYAATIPAGTQAMITPSGLTTDCMDTTYVNYTTTAKGAYYAATKPMTIDLQNKLGIVATANQLTSILLNGSNIELLNASEIRNSLTSIIVGSAANGVRIDGGKTMPMSGKLIQRFLEIHGGAQNVTFTNYTVGNLDPGTVANHRAAVQFSGGTAAKNIVIDNVTFTTTHDPYSSAYTCSETDSSGCVNNAIIFVTGANLNGLQISNSTFLNLKKASTSTDSVIFSVDAGNTTAGTLWNFDFHDNTIINSGSCSTISLTFANCGLIFLPATGIQLANPSYVRNNSFTVDPALKVPHAVTWFGKESTSTPNQVSGLFVQDNYFDGFTSAAILLEWVGLVSVERNTFGPKHFSNPDPVAEETASVALATYATTGAMFSNENHIANNKIVTWRPTGVTVISQGCDAVIQAAAPPAPPPANMTNPVLPIRLDVFWTATSKAEVFVGSSQQVLSGTTASIVVSLPPEAVGAGGKLTGNLRLQTQSLKYTQPSSSHYSRLIPLTGTGSDTCVPKGVDSISPVTGAIQGGELLTLTGSGFLGLTAGGISVTFNDDAICASLTVVDDETMTCVVPASTLTPSRSGPVTVRVLVKGGVLSKFIDGYTYRYTGDLTVVTRAWMDAPPGLADEALYDALMASGHGGATEVPPGEILRPGVGITWTYTVTYARLVGGQPDGGAYDIALTDVVVTDDRLGEVCTIPVLYMNTPYGCAAAAVLDL